MLVASPQASEAPVNRIMPETNTSFRPRRSATDPALSTTAARASVYASTTHCTPVSPACRSRARYGSAVFTTAISSISIAVARHVITSVPR